MSMDFQAHSYKFVETCLNSKGQFVRQFQFLPEVNFVLQFDVFNLTSFNSSIRIRIN